MQCSFKKHKYLFIYLFFIALTVKGKVINKTALVYRMCIW